MARLMSKTSAGGASSDCPVLREESARLVAGFAARRPAISSRASRESSALGLCEPHRCAAGGPRRVRAPGRTPNRHRFQTSRSWRRHSGNRRGPRRAPRLAGRLVKLRRSEPGTISSPASRRAADEEGGSRGWVRARSPASSSPVTRPPRTRLGWAIVVHVEPPADGAPTGSRAKPERLCARRLGGDSPVQNLRSREWADTAARTSRCTASPSRRGSRVLGHSGARTGNPSAFPVRARVSTLEANRAGAQIAFGSRGAPHCSARPRSGGASRGARSS
jgi:hypothetical protein